jgi:hypothetical protein
MRLFYKGKDGGAESTVWGFWLWELKRLCSVALLCFEDGTRDAYHSHAFNSISWVLSGMLVERFFDGRVRIHFPSLRPIVTRRTDFHQVRSYGRTWVLSLRGPWVSVWQEYLPGEQRFVELTHGRKERGGTGY